LEEELLARHIPFSIYGGLGFYERKEIKDVVAYLRSLLHPSDDMSWRRILNTPRRGIGKATIQAVESLASREGIPFSMALRRFSAEGRGAPASRIRAFLEIMDRLASAISAWTVKEMVVAVLHQTGYLDELQKEEKPRNQERMENIQELLNLIGEIEVEDDGKGLNDFLERVALISDVDRMDSREDRVSLMTLHSAKGLEFPVVFILGLEEGLMPHDHALEDQDELEEERRLCYVGMTRAQKKLYLTCASRRRIWGATRTMEPSRFLGEIPGECLQFHSPGFFDQTEAYSQGSTLPGIYAGRWVRHHAFGVGTVQRVEENGSRVVIHFPGVGDKRFIVGEAPLEWL
jgi:DNA helicase-2/ATP-dependent DNA helicase PcrA